MAKKKACCDGECHGKMGKVWCEFTGSKWFVPAVCFIIGFLLGAVIF